MPQSVQTIIPPGTALRVPNSTGDSSPIVEQLARSLVVIFSWAVLMPISVIVSGKFLGTCVRLGDDPKQLFRISIFGIIRIEATNNEVTLGFTGFICVFLFTGFVGGHAAYRTFCSNFGVDPGQWNALCVLSALFLVVCSVLVYMLVRVSRFRSSAFASQAAKHRDLLDSLKENSGKD